MCIYLYIYLIGCREIPFLGISFIPLTGIQSPVTDDFMEGLVDKDIRPHTVVDFPFVDNPVDPHLQCGIVTLLCI